jgi:protein-arginine kinase activator protein McsA
MKAYYASLIEDLESEGPDREKIKSDLEELIKKAVEIEDYEEAARIRDFMFFNKLK